jgi:hypothetical protein
MIQVRPKTKTTAQKLGIDPTDLTVIFQHESGNNPQAVNPLTRATGLIQFMPSTAKGLGTSTAALLAMDYDQQLDYVYKYLSPYKGKMKGLADIYLAVFYPAAIGKPDSYVLGSERGLAYAKKVANQNPANNPNKDDSITKGEVRQVIEAKAKSYGVAASNSVIKGFSKTPEFSLKNLFKK